MLIIVGLIALVHRLFSAEWFIVPGGTIARRFRLGGHRWALRQHTPANTLLIACNVTQGFQVSFWPLDGKKPVPQLVTDLELAALLAAWQSPIPTPPVEKLRDFRLGD